MDIKPSNSIFNLQKALPQKENKLSPHNVFQKVSLFSTLTVSHHTNASSQVRFFSKTISKQSTTQATFRQSAALQPKNTIIFTNQLKILRFKPSEKTLRLNKKSSSCKNNLLKKQIRKTKTQEVERKYVTFYIIHLICTRLFGCNVCVITICY